MTTAYTVKITNEAIEWTNSRGQVAKFTDSGDFIGFNGSSLRQAPSNSFALISALSNALCPEQYYLNPPRPLSRLRYSIFSSIIRDYYRIKDSGLFELLTFWDYAKDIEDLNFSDDQIERIAHVLKTFVSPDDKTKEIRFFIEAVILIRRLCNNVPQTILNLDDFNSEREIITMVNNFLNNSRGALSFEKMKSCLEEMSSMSVVSAYAFRKIETYLPQPLSAYPHISSILNKLYCGMTSRYSSFTENTSFLFEPDAMQAIAKAIRDDTIIRLRSFFEFSGSSRYDRTLNVCMFICSILQLQKQLGEPYSLSGNLINKVYQLYLKRDEQKNMLFAKRQNKQALKFSDDYFTVIIPQSNDELIREGERQHNCVGTYGYFDRVINGNSLIVFVREVGHEDKNLITCEIDPQTFAIKQFLSSHNSKAVSAKFINPENKNRIESFRHEYQTYLRTLLK